MEKAIIDIMTSRGLDKIHLEYLIDLGDDVDYDGEEFAITCDTLAIKDNQVIVYDSNNEDWNDEVEDEDIYKFSEIDEDAQKQALWCVEETLKYWDRTK